MNVWTGDRSEAESAARLRAFGAALRRSRWFLAAWMAAWLVVGVAYLASVKPEFVASVDVALEPQLLANDGPEDERHYHQFALDTEQADTELRLMRSETLLHPIFNQFDLSHAPELADRHDGFWPTTAHWLHWIATSATPYDAETRAFFAFMDRVRCLRLGLASVFEISYRSDDPNLAARVVNAIAAAYVADRLVAVRARLDRGGGPYRVARAEAIANQLAKARAATLAGAAATEDLPLSDVRVLGSATPPLAKTYPKPVPTLLFALGFAAVSGVLLVLLARVPAAARSRRRGNEGPSPSPRPRFSL
jgi:uncharacterized protein involved in exopolysaccharide biosynthesis